LLPASCGGSVDAQPGSDATRPQPRTQRSTAPPPSPDAGIPEGTPRPTPGRGAVAPGIRPGGAFGATATDMRASSSSRSRVAGEQGDQHALHDRRRPQEHGFVAVALEEAGGPAGAAQAARPPLLGEQPFLAGRGRLFEKLL
jgi:hypothetical protein